MDWNIAIHGFMHEIGQKLGAYGQGPGNAPITVSDSFDTYGELRCGRFIFFGSGGGRERRVIADAARRHGIKICETREEFWA